MIGSRLFVYLSCVVVTTACTSETGVGDRDASERDESATGAAAATGGLSGDPMAGTGGQITSGSGGTASSTGGSAAGGGATLELVGDPPVPSQHPATSEHWDVLPATDEFATYYGSAPFAIDPLSSDNFPVGYDYCNAAGGDTELNEQQQFARVQLKADLKTWYYDVTLISVPEEDGLTPYQLLIDGVVVREYTTPPTGTEGAADNVDFPHVWETVPIEAGQVIEVRTRANSNLAILEGGTCRTYSEAYAWARGRFSGMNFAPAESPPQ